MKSLAPNTLLQNRYLVVQLIGKGGMGEVYLAVDQRLGSAVALKRMLYSDEEALGQAFEREAKTLARLRHPALTKVSDHFNENGMQYLVMEHISGDDLSKRLEQNNKPFPLSWVLYWADQLLEALHYLHSHEPPIIHRDIKPQNLKLTGDNQIILLDFGLAKDSVGETRLSTTGNVIAYTPNYASMEQIRGTGTTARSDIYALSATMYQLLSNVVPADALTRADSVLNSLPDPVTALSEINPEVIPAISTIITKGMSLSAEQRFASAKEMQLALREAYAQYQQGMSANTVAFNVSEQAQEPATPLPQSDIKTEVFSIPNVSVPVGEKTEVMPVNLTAQNIVQETAPPVNYDATIPYSTPFTEEPITPPITGDKTEVIPAEVSQSLGYETQVSPIDYSFPVGEKTEVISNDVPVGAKTEVIPNEYSGSVAENTATFSADATAQNISAFDDFAENKQESFENQESSSAQESFSPEMTVPLVNYGDQVSELPSNETSNFVAIPPNETANYPAEEVAKPVIAEVKEEPKKKAAASGGGGSKALMIVGILAVLAFLGIGAAGAGLYVFMPELFGAATPTPQPTATPIATPTVSPTPEPTLQADSNTDTGNSSVSLTNTNTDSGNTAGNQTEVAGDKTPQPTVEKTTQPTVQPTKQPNVQPTKQPTVQPTKPPPSPKVTPTKQPTVDRTRPIP
jgi:serine/threonine protein kinase